MGFLGVLRLGLVFARGGRHIAIAEETGHELADRGDRLGHDLHAVGPHISNEAFGLAAKIDAFIEPLGELHGLARREAELARGLLLKRRGGEGRGRIAALRLALDIADREAAAFEGSLEPVGVRLVGDVELLELLAFGGDEPCLESLVLGRRQLGSDRPIFLRLELLDLQLAIAHEPERHRLHAAGGAGARQLPPQDRRQGEADEIVERAAGEIGVDQGAVDLARMAHGVEHRLFGDGVEHHPLDGDLVQDLLAVQHLEHMPRDGLALAVGVRGEDQLVGALDRLGDLIQPLGGLGINVPMHLEVVVRQDGPVLRGQVAHMPVGCEHAVSWPEILVDGLCLGWRFDDDDVH